MASKHEQREAAASKPAQTAKPKRTVRRTSLQGSVPRVLVERGLHGTMWFGIITEKESDRGGRGNKTDAGKTLSHAARTEECRFEDSSVGAIEEDDCIASASIDELDVLLVRLDEGTAAERSVMDSLLERLAARVPR